MMVCNPSDDICCHMWWQHICDDITSRSVMSDSLWPQDCSPLGSSVHGDSPGKNTRVGCYFLLQGLFPTQGLNPGLPHHRWILYYLSHQGSPNLGQNHLRSCWRGEPPGLSNWIFLVWVQCTNQSASAGWSITLVILSSHESLGLGYQSEAITYGFYFQRSLCLVPWYMKGKLLNCLTCVTAAFGWDGEQPGEH